MSYIERSGVNIQARFQGYSRKAVGNIQDFVVGLQDCLLTNVKKMFLEVMNCTSASSHGTVPTLCSCGMRESLLLIPLGV